MPTYNGGKFLREQLDSIYTQTLLPDEVIVVDDCSTDDTVKILEEYKMKYGLKYFINEKNLGYNKNFERAITLCTGDYIALADQDDIWLPTKIEKCYNVIKETDPDIPSLVSCFNSTSKDVLGERQVIKGVVGSWKHNLTIYTSQGCTLMFNRKLLQYIIPFQPDIMYDAYIGFVASLIGNRYYIGEKLMYYRIHSNNAFASNKITLCNRLNNNLLRTIPFWFTLKRYNSLSVIKDKYNDIIEEDKLKYLNTILNLYEINKVKRLILFNTIKEIPLTQKIKTTIGLFLKIIFRIEDKY